MRSSYAIIGLLVAASEAAPFFGINLGAGTYMPSLGSLTANAGTSASVSKTTVSTSKNSGDLVTIAKGITDEAKNTTSATVGGIVSTALNAAGVANVTTDAEINTLKQTVNQLLNGTSTSTNHTVAAGVPGLGSLLNITGVPSIGSLLNHTGASSVGSLLNHTGTFGVGSLRNHTGESSAGSTATVPKVSASSMASVIEAIKNALSKLFGGRFSANGGAAVGTGFHL